MKRILITGGQGYLGGRLADYFYDNGYQISILIRKMNPDLTDWSKKFDIIYADLTEPHALKGICDGKDYVIHTAALNDKQCRDNPEEALLVNSYGTRLILEEARKANIKRFVYLSTFHVYDKTRSRLITEETPINPLTEYSLTHYFAENYSHYYRNSGWVDTVVVRITNGYGAPVARSVNCWMLAMNDFCKSLMENRKIVLKTRGLQKRDFISISDICRGIILLLESSQPVPEDNGNYNLGSGYIMSIYELASLVLDVYIKHYNQRGKILIKDNKVHNEVGGNHQVSIDKIAKLGYKPCTDIRTEILRIFKVLETE